MPSERERLLLSSISELRAKLVTFLREQRFFVSLLNDLIRVLLSASKIFRLNDLTEELDSEKSKYNQVSPTRANIYSR